MPQIIINYLLLSHNAKEEVMIVMSIKGPYVNNYAEAEVLACKKVIEFSIEAGFSELVIEGDNVNVMMTISCSSVNHSFLGHIFEDVH